MCIDKLDLEYLQPHDSGTSARSFGNNHAPEDVFACIEGAGFDAGLNQYARRGQTRFKITIRDDDNTAYFQLSGNINQSHGLCLYKMDINPSKFTSFMELWHLLIRIAPFFRQDIFQDGIVKRIDYMLDYQKAFSEFREGVFYDPVLNLYVCANEDMSLREFHYDPVDFKSFRIGKGNKVFKFYDKGWEEHPRRGNRRAPIRPKSRIELSITTTARIADFWGERYRGRLSELPHHLQDIIAGNKRPFSAVTLYKVQHRASDRRGYEYKNNQQNNQLRFKIQYGLLNSIWRECRQLGINFWDHTLYAFAMFRWDSSYQPTQAYASRLNAWVYLHRPYDTHGVVLPTQYAHRERMTAGNLASRDVFIKPRHPSQPVYNIGGVPIALYQSPVISEVSP